MAVPPSPLLALPGAVAASGADASVAAHYGNPIAEQRMLDAARERGAVPASAASVPVIVDLSSRGVISVEGPDRLSWLDSVTSQSIRDLPAGGSAETLLLDINGRIEHAIRVIDDGVTAWLLVDGDETESLTAWLLRMRFMLRVEIADRTDEFATIGWLASSADAPTTPALAGRAAAPAGIELTWVDPWPEVVAGGVQYAPTDEHPGADWWWRETLVPREALGALADTVVAGDLAVAGLLAAEALRIVAWRPRLSTEVDDRSIPHELDWMRSAVHLSKGCYRGQETVAKVHNLGHPPRRLVLLDLDGSDAVLPAAGDEVFVSAGPEGAGSAAPADAVGHVTSVALHHEWGPVALAIVKRQLPVDASLVVRTAEGDVNASAVVIVSPDAGAAVGRVPRLPRLGARTR
ncbi:MAG: folate-binding protein [Herbiconiux sp.]|uniref:CAF17-like 4Fe-4S cluster assembly/insertion protein YgfZ n=1 Tax=Herbiconiux sp. TaxID=1871186 RepID=UPI00121BCF62|nr:folate-binding protein [Herbiconiux sp.]TAJ47576.1 MAG: folate-binding protein [Herbiconiux sp.]